MILDARNEKRKWLEKRRFFSTSFCCSCMPTSWRHSHSPIGPFRRAISMKYETERNTEWHKTLTVCHLISVLAYGSPSHRTQPRMHSASLYVYHTLLQLIGRHLTMDDSNYDACMRSYRQEIVRDKIQVAEQEVNDISQSGARHHSSLSIIHRLFVRFASSVCVCACVLCARIYFWFSATATLRS